MTGVDGVDGAGVGIDGGVGADGVDGVAGTDGAGVAGAADVDGAAGFGSILDPPGGTMAYPWPLRKSSSPEIS